MKAYFISGLGADERVFRYLDLPDIKRIYLKWLTPNPLESIASYSKRLLQQIDSNEAVILIGVSFGGIIAQEIAKLIACEKVIIISSIKSSKEFCWQYNLIRQTKAYKLFSPSLLKKANLLAADYFFSVKTKGESIFLRQIILETSEEFLRWAIVQIMIWNNLKTHPNLLHIHGTEDRIFPYFAIKNCISIKEGGHFMIVNRAKEISDIILSEIKSLSH